MSQEPSSRAEQDLRALFNTRINEAIVSAPRGKTVHISGDYDVGFLRVYRDGVLVSEDVLLSDSSEPGQ